MPEEFDLLSVLQEPPQGPFAQAGSMLQGYAAGFRGQQNPALLQAQQEQRNRLAVAGVILSAQRERRLKDTTLLELNKSLAQDQNPEVRSIGLKYLFGYMEKQGLPTPQLSQTMLYGQLKPGELKEIAELKDLEWTPEAIQGLHPGMNPKLWPEVDKILRDDDTRRLWGIKTRAQIKTQKLEEEAKSRKALEEAHAPELHGNPMLYPFIIMAARIRYRKEFIDLSLPEREQAFNDGILLSAKAQGEINSEKVYQAVLARFDAQKKGPQKDYFNANYPYIPLQGSTTLETAEALEATQGATKLLKADQPSIKYIPQVKEALDRYRDAIRSNPSIIPKETGNKAQDVAALALAYPRYLAALKTDPMTVPLTAIKRHVVNLARISGTGSRLSNYVAQLESMASGFDRLDTQGVKLGLANQVEDFLNNQLASMGLKPLPPWKPGIIGRTKTGKVVWKPGDGSQPIEITAGEQ